MTRLELVLTLAAFAAAGTVAGDRIEHASVTPPEELTRIAALGLAVVTQPGFISARGDAYLRDVDPADLPWLYRARAFVDAGVTLAAGSDAPFGPLDPWRAMASAVSRCTATRRLVGPEEALTPEGALALFLACPGDLRRRQLAAPQVGDRADLCLLEDPWRAVRDDLAAARVQATWIAGVPVHGSPAS